jgi:hypothetical protein
MSKCHIEIELGDEKKELMAKAKKAITKAGGELDGDDAQGHFNIPTPIGKITGDYTITDNTFTLDVTQKPLLVTCKRIETEITKYLHPDPPVA